MIVTEDHFIEEDDYVYAGKHLIVDIYGFDKEYKKFKLLLAKASQLAGAKLLYAYTHEFEWWYNGCCRISRITYVISYSSLKEIILHLTFLCVVIHNHIKQ